jgi:carbonic anhydrase
MAVPEREGIEGMAAPADSTHMQTLRSWRHRGSRVPVVVAAFVALASLSPRAAAPEPAAPLARLRAGNERFVKGASAAVPLGAPTRQSLAAEQHPFAMVLTCADSRVPPEYIFNAGLGELFVVRTAGPVVDKAVMASLEYGAEHLHVPLLVVMGHESCDVVKAATDVSHGDGATADYLTSRVRAGLHHSASEQQDLRTAILANVEQAINDAMSGSLILRNAATGGRLQVVGAYYESGSGTVVFSEPVAAATAGTHQ